MHSERVKELTIELIQAWLSRLDELQPVDGRLTTDIIEASGGLPIDVATPDGPLSDKQAQRLQEKRADAGNYAKAAAGELARTRYQFAMAAYRDAEQGGDGEKIAKSQAHAQYWQDISQWLDEMPMFLGR